MTTEREVHPAAAVFPMLPDDELRELAADIKANGLNHAITLDAEGRIVDGRNRDAACKLAGVEPRYETLDAGRDPIAFILSQNVHRRHLTEGQRAIAVVRAIGSSNLQETRGSKAAAAETAATDAARISQALVIVEYAPVLADAVMAGAKAFSVAYREACEIRDAQRDRESSAAVAAAKLERVRGADADLALLVAEGRLSIDDADALIDKRAAEVRERRLRQTRYFVDHSMGLRSLLWRSAAEILDEWEDDATEHQRRGPFAEHVWSPAGLRSLAADLDSLARAMETREEVTDANEESTEPVRPISS
jgi:hypothetical protein